MTLRRWWPRMQRPNTSVEPSSGPRWTSAERIASASSGGGRSWPIWPAHALDRSRSRAADERRSSRGRSGARGVAPVEGPRSAALLRWRLVHRRRRGGGGCRARLRGLYRDGLPAGLSRAGRAAPPARRADLARAPQRRALARDPDDALDRDACARTLGAVPPPDRARVLSRHRSARHAQASGSQPWAHVPEPEANADRPG